MPPSRDDETETEEQATLAGQYYLTLTRQGVPPMQAAQITSAWILGRLRVDGDATGRDLLGGSQS